MTFTVLLLLDHLPIHKSYLNSSVLLTLRSHFLPFSFHVCIPLLSACVHLYYLLDQQVYFDEFDVQKSRDSQTWIRAHVKKQRFCCLKSDYPEKKINNEEKIFAFLPQIDVESYYFSFEVIKQLPSKQTL